MSIQFLGHVRDLIFKDGGTSHTLKRNICHSANFLLIVRYNPYFFHKSTLDLRSLLKTKLTLNGLVTL